MHFDSLEIPESIIIEDNSLKLNGAGWRRLLFAKIYVASFYSETSLTSFSEVLKTNGTCSISLTLNISLGSGNMIGFTLREGLKKYGKEKMEAINPFIQKMANALTIVSADKADRFDLAFLPGNIASIYKNDKLLFNEMGSSDLKAAILGIWLGENPASISLRSELLKGFK